MTAGMRGVVPILAMPFHEDGSIDVESLRHEAEWAIGCGVDGLGLARASEVPRLSEAERSLVTRAVVEQAAGRAPVVVLAAAESAHLAIELALRAESDGASALMVSPPTFEADRPGQERFYRELAAATALPILLQDIPIAPVDAALAMRLDKEHPGRFGLKAETPPTPPAVERAVAATGGRMPVLGGAGGLHFYGELIRGALGTMPGCVIPELFVDVWRLWQAGDADGARCTFSRFALFLATTGHPGLILSYYREALVRRGVFHSAAARSPAAILGAAERRELHELLDDLELAPVAAVRSTQRD
jgi:4-hydroxy-tetrahydrodipicolinate synthase